MKTKNNLSFEKKVKLLTEMDKIYLDGYMDRAINCYMNGALKNNVAEKKRQKRKHQNRQHRKGTTPSPFFSTFIEWILMI